jgi:hypothetical protein
LLVEVTPEELKSRGETKGRPEYPEVVWPYLQEHSSHVEALEPAEDEYKRLVNASSNLLTELKSERPRHAAYWSSYQKSLEAALLAYWTVPERTQDAVTADLARSWYATQQVTLGPAYARIQDEWDGGMADRVRSAIKQFSSRRIVVLVSYRNRYLIEEAARKTDSRRVQDVSRWLGPEASVCRSNPQRKE